MTIVDRKGLAKLFEVSESTVKKWDAMDLYPRLKVGNVVRYDVERVRAALAKLERK